MYLTNMMPSQIKLVVDGTAREGTMTIYFEYLCNIFVYVYMTMYMHLIIFFSINQNGI